jgi:hypothetical protein
VEEKLQVELTMDLKDKMDRSTLLKQLDKATDRAATFAIQRGLPISISKNSTLIGSLFVEKNKFGLYDILKANKKILYENICAFDIAIIIAQRHNNNETSVVKKVLYLEAQFSKFHNDMVNYLYCMKTIKKKDFCRLAILEDRFQMAELSAKSTRDKIAIFKRMK